MANIWWTMMIYSTLFEVYDDAIFMLYLTLQRRNILRASCNIRIHFKMHELLSSTLFPNTKVLTKVSVSLEAKKKVYDSKKILSRSRTKIKRDKSDLFFPNEILCFKASSKQNDFTLYYIHNYIYFGIEHFIWFIF